MDVQARFVQTSPFAEISGILYIQKCLVLQSREFVSARQSIGSDESFPVLTVGSSNIGVDPRETYRSHSLPAPAAGRSEERSLT